jgi:hypothetical protein
MKTLLKRLDVYAVNYCNFHCANCLAFCRQQKIHAQFPAKCYIDSLKHLQTYADIQLLHIVGGEPTLHSNLEDFVIQIREILSPNTQLEVISNGWWMPDEDKFGHIWSKIDKLGQGIHPELLNRLSLDDIRACMKRIRNKYHIITDLYIDETFSPLCFTDISNNGITKKCRFGRCTILLNNGNMYRCGAITCIPTTMTSLSFNKILQNQEYNVYTGNPTTLDKWLHTTPPYCTYCTGDTIKVPHFGYNTEIIQEYKYPEDD